jgi:DNA invertase Pin-like site-specific DNA recombinase
LAHQILIFKTEYQKVYLLSILVLHIKKVSKSIHAIIREVSKKVLTLWDYKIIIVICKGNGGVNMPNVYGYHRTSTIDQHLDRGVKAIKDYCQKNNIELTEMFTDQQTGKNFNRPDYLVLKRIAKNKDDIIILSELDRLGRNKEDTLKELQHYKSLGVRILILEIPTTLIDYSQLDDSMASMIMETVNNMLIEMYATFAHAEMQKRVKRQREGIQAKKDRNDWANYGRPKVIDYNKFAKEYQKVENGTLKPFECMRQLNMTKSTFYRYKKQFEVINGN